MAKAMHKNAKPKAFQVKPVKAALLAAIVLEELSRDYPEQCNYLADIPLLKQGDIWLAYTGILERHRASPPDSAVQHWVYAQAEGVLKKLVDPAFDRWTPTGEKWWKNERRCARQNNKFMAWVRAATAFRSGEAETPPPFYAEVVRLAEALEYAVGSEPPISDILEAAHYGPGSSTDVRGEVVHYARKIESSECTPRAVELAARSLALDKAIWEHHGLRPEYAVGNPDAYSGAVRVIREALLGSVNDRDRLLFIHKGIESLRSIGAQPTCSGHLQLGVHSVLTRMLLDVGIDLADQGKNQAWARKGSLDWHVENPLCTLDKSDASNLIARMVVQLGFPAAWARLLDQIRTPNYEAPPEIGGGTHAYSMYAGMGNGTTFTVETLLFWAASYATQELPVSEFVKRGEYAIYGDDVILRREHAIRYMRFAKFLGFRFNAKKTFLDGPFRESCGCDYYAGIDVRPAILDCETDTLAMADIVAFHNTLADQPNFALPGALRRIRQVWATHVNPVLPTDPQGTLGFRPGPNGGYNVVRDAGGNPLLSTWWQRPRYFMLKYKQKFGTLGDIGPYTQLAVSAMRARQSGETGYWALPLRDRAVNYQLVPERDMERKPLVQMVANTLAHLAQRKAEPWWEISRGSKTDGS